ncbi:MULTISPECIES: DUF932 domain-containing protein [unclassified Streptomyces]|uniref:DUF932 domain-containing protein n=1 Tax=unclassified Streptomyces TaxID=2593676 RepID=UPI002DD8E580|nr:DUF932 domain-containing protein [Streptomyces sp. NBC_01795]WSA97784.1 DUF945 domain-containing protein [Streptomyces sp. NBC_01795]WSS46699.1 DUF945 domain-containing protein [Streptomyces sp. NBC_01187]WSS47084.1 DUF945 domain-containing protein [Streptomyces sp. NBC_01187]
MAHEIEQFEDGTAAFASARLSAWHGLGTVTKDAMTAEEAMQIASLGDWNVRLLPLTATEQDEHGEPNTLHLPDHFASARTNPKLGRTEALGVVGSDYVPVQNEEHAEFLNLLADESGAHFETAGSLKNGRQVFLTMKLPQAMTIGASDRVDLYIAAFNSHDGSSAFRTVVTPIRVVCANTQRAALNNAYASYSVRHTAGAKSRIAQARKALGLTFKYAEEFEKAAQRMVQEEMALSELRAVIDEIWPAGEDQGPRARNYQEQRTGQIIHLFDRAETQAGIRGTRWAGYQAITEYVDHFQPSRGRTSQEKTAARAERVISGSADAVKTKAFALTSV